MESCQIIKGSSPFQRRYPPEMRERAVRLVAETIAEAGGERQLTGGIVAVSAGAGCLATVETGAARRSVSARNRGGNSRAMQIYPSATSDGDAFQKFIEDRLSPRLRGWSSRSHDGRRGR